MNLEAKPDLFAVCRLDAATPIPSWALASPFFSVTRTQDELSIVCSQSAVPDTVKCEKNWRCLKVAGPLDFGLTGILASLAGPLAHAEISIFAVSTFDTDYLLVKHDCYQKAVEVLAKVGHVIHPG